jgi:DNA-binding MarR family transcriptional regulator
VIAIVMTRLEKIGRMEQTGLLRTLILLSEKKRYITELKKTGLNPEGVGSLETLSKVRMSLSQLGLAIEELEEGHRPKTFLVITEKGRRVAEKVKEIQEILEET